MSLMLSLCALIATCVFDSTPKAIANPGTGGPSLSATGDGNGDGGRPHKHRRPHKHHRHHRRPNRGGTGGGKETGGTQAAAA